MDSGLCSVEPSRICNCSRVDLSLAFISEPCQLSSAEVSLNGQVFEWSLVGPRICDDVH